MNMPKGQPNLELRKYKWFKWGHRIFLILAVIMPSVYTLIYFLFIERVDPSPLSEWDVLKWTIAIIPVAVLAWFMPILGGILIFIGTHMALLGYSFAASYGDIGVPGYFIFPHYSILVISGILSFEWGIVRRRERKYRSG
jgi:hypothetical protein